MQQIAHYCMYRPEQRCSVGLFAGDLSKNMSGTAADLLIVSAFRCDYLSTSTSVIGKLARAAGVNFPGLKEHAASLNCDCWLSPMLDEALAEKIGTKRILCYEGGHDNPVESLQTMFSALIQAAVNQSVCLDTLMMPLLCAGDQHADPLRMLREILMATAASFEAGLPVKDVRIVVLPDRADTYSGTFKEIVHQYDPFSSAIDPPTEYDLFLIYSPSRQTPGGEGSHPSRRNIRQAYPHLPRRSRWSESRRCRPRQIETCDPGEPMHDGILFSILCWLCRLQDGVFACRFTERTKAQCL